MPRLPVPENDYRPLASRDPGPPRLSVAVVIPVYERVALLRRTLAGLAAQTGYPPESIEVVVADDGSTEDVATVVAEFSASLRITGVRRDHAGYGAGAARNLGAAATEADVLLFVDADCLPVPGLVAAHMAWHHRSSRAVVIGARQHIDSSALDADAIGSGAIDIAALAGGDREPDDWRQVFYRRTGRLTRGSEAYRAVVSNNLSMSHRWFDAVGGFSERFTRWGGEDTELGWRLWQAGLHLIPDDTATILHQGQDDGDRSWRDRDRSDNMPLIESLVPHRFYRKDLTSPAGDIPKVSWIVTSQAGSRAGELLGQMAAQRVADWDARFPLDTGVTGDVRLRAAADSAGSDGQRVLRAIAASSAEYVALVTGAAGLDPLLLDRTVRALDRSQRASIATVGIDGDEAAAAWSPFGMPPFALVRRREWAKVLEDERDTAAAWSAVAACSRSIHLTDVLVTLPPPAAEVPATVVPAVSPRTRAVESARTGGWLRQTVYRLGQALLRRRRPQARGLAALAHFGDERSAAAIAAAAPWASLADSGTIQGIVVGGGLTIDEALAERIALLESPRVERIVAGASLGPDPGAWRDLLATCVAIGVATDDDAATAAAAGLAVTVIGHPADRPDAAGPVLGALQKEIA